MNAPSLERTSAAKAGWLIIVLTVGWMVFVLWPDPESEPAPKAAPIPPPVTSLTRAGLRENPDWEGLPEIFAIWADRAEWRNGRTRFNYWNPVTNVYSYTFEARKTKGGYMFKEVDETDQLTMGEMLAEDCPIRFLYQPRFSNDPVRLKPLPIPGNVDSPRKVDVDLAVPKK